jgi:ribonuclease R
MNNDLSQRPKYNGITIDSASTIDIDDGLSIEQLGNSWKIEVSIADVGYGIFVDSEADKRARHAAFSRYQGTRIKTPMLPYSDTRRLSLNEGENHPALTVSILLNEKLDIVQTKIHRSVFYNIKKTTYDEIQQAVSQKNPRIGAWGTLAQKLLDKRRAEGAFTFYDFTKGIVVDEEGVVKALPARGHIGYILVQEMMILTNHAVAAYCRTHNIPVLYRNHAARVGAHVDRRALIHNVAELRETLNVEDIEAFQTKLRAIFERARYEPEAKGHFGLSLAAYLHFTSPIRRYADLVVHRQLTAFLEGKPYIYDSLTLETLAAEINDKNDVYKIQRETSFELAAIQKISSMLMLPSTPVHSFMELSNTHWKWAIRMARENNAFNSFFQALTLRMTQPNFPALALYELLRPDAPPLTGKMQEMQAIALQYLRDHPATLMNLAGIVSVEEEEEEPVLKQIPVERGYVIIPVITFNGQSLAPPEVRAFPLKQDAIRDSMAAFWGAFTRNEAVPPEHTKIIPLPPAEITQEPPMPNASSEKNPISILMEASQKLGFSVVDRYTQEGPPHDPVFTCRLVFENYPGRDAFIYEGRACSKKEAKVLAAQKAVTELELNKTDATITTTASMDAAGKNPVSLVMEFCQARKLPPPEYTCAEEGADHTKTFKYSVAIIQSISDRTPLATGHGSAKNKKEAQRLAAQSAWKALLDLRL